MNQRTLAYQQAKSKLWSFHKTPELKAFYPQDTFGEDLTNFSIPIDPTWNLPGHSDTSDTYIPEDERLVDPLFGNPVDNIRLNSPHAKQVRRFREKWKKEVAELTEEVEYMKAAHKRLEQKIQDEYDAPTYRGSEHHHPPVYNWRIEQSRDDLARVTSRLSDARKKLIYWNDRL
jgi:hypothetical protein